MKKFLTSLVVIAVLAGAAGGYYKWRNPAREPVVNTARVIRGDVISEVGATGTLEPVTKVVVGTQVSGMIKELLADFNSIVKKDQVIARLDPLLLQAQVDQARANLVRSEAEVERLKVSLEDAQKRLERTRELASRNLVPKTELEAAEVAVKAAESQLRSALASKSQSEAAVNQAQVNLEHSIITSPIDGIVISRPVDVGQTVAASMNSPTLFEIAADLAQMKLTANIDEAEVSKIRPGQPVRFRVDAYPTDVFTGTVRQVRLQPIVQQNVVTYATVIDVPNPELKLKPGMTAQVQIEVARVEDVLKVPNAALRFRPTDEVYAALKQTPPPTEFGRGRRQRGGNTDGRSPEEDRGAGGTRPSGTSGHDAAPGTTAGLMPGAAASQARGERLRGGEPQTRGQGRGGQRMSDEERQRRLEERLKQMTPEEREEFLRRMRQRGQRPGEGGGTQGSRGTAPGRVGGRPGEPTTGRSMGAWGGRGGTAAAAAAPVGPTDSMTIDALFGPLPAVEGSGTVYTFDRQLKQLKATRIRVGIADGTHTALISGDLKEGMELVTGVILPTEQTTTAAGRSPLMPPQRGRGGDRGFGPGGFGGPGGGFGGPGGGFGGGGGGRGR